MKWELLLSIIELKCLHSSTVFIETFVDLYNNASDLLTKAA